MLRTMLVFTLMFSLHAFAQGKGGRGGGGPGGGGPGGGGRGAPNPACAPIRTACEKAGYKGRTAEPGSPGSIRDCMQKWGSGESIPGVTIKPSDSSGKDCAAHMAKMKTGGGPGGRGGGGKGGMGMGRGGGGPGGGPGGRPGAQPPPSPLMRGQQPPTSMAPKAPPPAATPPPKKP